MSLNRYSRATVNAICRLFGVVAVAAIVSSPVAQADQTPAELKPDVVRVPVHGAALLGGDIEMMTLEWLQAQDWARHDFIVLEGTSMGGLTAVATAAVDPPGVVGCINFSGGVGGDPQRAPGNSMLMLRGGKLWSVHTDRFIHELGM